MGALRCFLTTILGVAALIASAAAFAQGNAGADQKRVALVIGNASYPTSPLRNPVNDAKDIAATLRKLGFDVIERINATQKDMNRAIGQFGSKLSADSVALFFYAGHGIQVRGKNYLIPVDAQIDTENTVRAETVDVDTVLDQLGGSPLNLVILDACRNNPFERRFRSTGGGLAQMEAPKGTLISYATAPGKVASDGDGRNGLFTQELLKAIDTPGIKVEDVFKRVRANVARASRDEQLPWESSSLTGDFYFKLASVDSKAGKGASQDDIDNAVAKAVAAATAKAAQERAATESSAREMAERMVKEALDRQRALAEQERLTREHAEKMAAGQKQLDPLAVELAFWNSIKTATSAGDYQAYLKKYPEGQFAELARSRIDALKAKTTATASAPMAAPSTAGAGGIASPASPSTVRPGWPQVGDRFTYRYTDEWKPSQTREIAHEVLAVTDAGIMDRMQITGDKAYDDWVYTGQPQLVSRKAGKTALLDFSPYLQTFGNLEVGAEMRLPEMEPDENVGPYSSVAKVVAKEKITVAAGQLDTVRIEINGNRRTAPGPVSQLVPARIFLVVWYSPQIGRYVKLEHRSWNGGGKLLDQEIFELTSKTGASSVPATAAANRFSAGAVAVDSTPPPSIVRPGWPQVGDRFTYRYTDEWKPSQTREIVNEVAVVTEAGVTDRMQVTGDKGSDEWVYTGMPPLISRKIGKFELLDFSPYLPAFEKMEVGTDVKVPDFELADLQSPISSSMKIVAKERIAVPAGQFDTFRVEFHGNRNNRWGSALISLVPARYQVLAWYSTDFGRYVKLEYRSWNAGGTALDRETLELTKKTGVSVSTTTAAANK